VKLAPLTESLYYGDENLLRQMISNLLDNAVKFTPRGGSVNLQPYFIFRYRSIARRKISAIDAPVSCCLFFQGVCVLRQGFAKKL
jgi:hypothetical protein